MLQLSPTCQALCQFKTRSMRWKKIPVPQHPSTQSRAHGEEVLKWNNLETPSKFGEDHQQLSHDWEAELAVVRVSRIRWPMNDIRCSQSMAAHSYSEVQCRKTRLLGSSILDVTGSGSMNCPTEVSNLAGPCFNIVPGHLFGVHQW